ncbi:rho guanine nucleotide exchange factor 18a [Colossoma macropomum]|uniref:rho guanine nucleotide exchange factor 18a n=1 Tax=Colossoma macropomum TaxID=42526 RepID=UPI0018642F48|nr:rho guanine nucleotide exchange factor 18a [Colossoma macropomum]XP_036452493.1 rho guanine nucleotide exchange factor 18a [Colossoma macropomum]XP_036452494.1 rho guanine nucleotide exchange factor 18a [Colossoma macropomum]
MDETEPFRPKVLPEDSASLSTSVVDGLKIEDDQYSALREDLEADARDFESPTWTLTVDQQYVKAFTKEAKRQDVIHELIQTEINHMRTLRVMSGVYFREVRDSLPKDEVQLDRLFPCLDHLLKEHQNFLNRLKQQRKQYLEPGSQQNYCISRIGDVLRTQFSGELRSRLLDGYGVFCSCHTDAVNYYKELQQNNKKFQNLMRKLGQLAIVRRLGVPEGILLITQRITKYPVLVERLIKNTEAGTEEYEDLVAALECIKETISQVDEQVHQYEKLRELVFRLDPKTQARMGNGQVIRREDLIQHGRSVLREGLLSWRASNRAKVSDVLVVLLSDSLLLLQEKDQKLIFASLDGKPAVLSLQRLIVRESAQSEKMMYLISTSDEKADMYEFHALSEVERKSWKDQIWQAIEWFSLVAEEDDADGVDQEDGYSEKLQVYHGELCVKDAQIAELLQQKLKLFSEFAEVTDGSALPKRLLLTGSTTQLQQGEQLLLSAIADAEGLQNLLLASESDFPSVDMRLPSRSNTIAGFTKSGGGYQDGFRNRNQRPNSDPHLRELYLDSLELSADGELWSSPQQAHLSRHQLAERVARLTQKLYSLQAVVAQQDSEVELNRAALAERPTRYRVNGLLLQEKQRHLEKQREELQQLQRVYNQQKQEQDQWEQEHQRHLQEREVLSQELKQRQEECQREEARLAAERDTLARSRDEYQQDLERLRDAHRDVEKKREELEQKEQKGQQLNKYKKTNNRASFYQSPTQNFPHQRVPVSSVDDMYLIPKHYVGPTRPLTSLDERPPQVPPRKESIAISPVKKDVPIQLVSTTNQALKPGSVQQQIPTKLAMSKGKDKEKGKSKNTHHRTNSAASIEVSAVVPIKGKEGGSMRETRSPSRQPLTTDMYTPPEQVLNTKPPLHSAKTHSSRKQSHASAANRPASHKVKDNGNKDDIFYL